MRLQMLTGIHLAASRETAQAATADESRIGVGAQARDAFATLYQEKGQYQ